MLEKLALIASIVTPFVLAALGWYIPQKIARVERRKIAVADFNVGWNKQFSDACMRYNESISEFSSLFFDAIQSSCPASIEEGLVNQVANIRRQRHHIMILEYSISNAEKVIDSIEKAQSVMEMIWKESGGNFDQLNECQKRISRELRDWKQQEIEI